MKTGYVLLLLIFSFTAPSLAQVPISSTWQNPGTSGIPYPGDLVYQFNVSVGAQQYDCGSYSFCQEIDSALYWGIVSNECPEASLPSGILYTFPSDQMVVLNQVVDLGQISSRNVIIQSDPGNPAEVIMILDVVVNGVDRMIEIELAVDETVNAEPCPYVIGTPGEVPCSDRHRYTIPDMEIFVFEGHTYELDFAFPGNVDVITPELCQPETVVPNGFQGTPTPLPAYITCVDCCDIYAWFNDVSYMYVPWDFHIQRAPGFRLGETISGVIVLDGPMYVVLTDIIQVLEEEEVIFTWAPHGLLPGTYLVTFNTGYNLGPSPCGSGYLRIVVPADYW